MIPKLYITETSPPCRAVLLTAKALGVTLNLQYIDIINCEYNQYYFTKVNMQCTVPTLDDNRYRIWDSHAINAYLVGKYGKDDALYPKNVEYRGLVDQRLHFDSGVLLPLIPQIINILKFQGINGLTDELISNVYKCYEIVEKFLEGRQYVAGNTVTIADFSLIASITTLDVLVPIARQKYSNVVRWIRSCQALPYYQENLIGLQKFKELVKDIYN